MKRLVTHIVLVLAIICGLSAVPHAIAKFASESLSPKERIEVFETIWKTINEDYYDPEFLSSGCFSFEIFCAKSAKSADQS